MHTLEDKLKEVCLELHGYTAAIMLPNYTKEVLESRYHYNLDPSWAKLTNAFDASTNNGTAFTTGQPVIKNNLGLPTLRDATHQHPIEAVIVVPIMESGKALGTVVVIADNPKVTFGETELTILDNFATEAVKYIR